MMFLKKWDFTHPYQFQCPQCGCEMLDEFYLKVENWAAIDYRYKSKLSEVLALPVCAAVCPECGFISLYTNAEKIQEFADKHLK